jgi:hypothetical protein
VGKNWYQSNRHENLYCRQVSFSMPQGTPSREEYKHSWRLYYFLTPSQPVGLVIFLSGKIILWIFCYSVGGRQKITNVYAEIIYFKHLKEMRGNDKGGGLLLFFQTKPNSV